MNWSSYVALAFSLGLSPLAHAEDNGKEQIIKERAERDSQDEALLQQLQWRQVSQLASDCSRRFQYRAEAFALITGDKHAEPADLSELNASLADYAMALCKYFQHPGLLSSFVIRRSENPGCDPTIEEIGSITNQPASVPDRVTGESITYLLDQRLRTHRALQNLSLATWRLRIKPAPDHSFRYIILEREKGPAASGFKNVDRPSPAIAWLQVLQGQHVAIESLVSS